MLANKKTLLETFTNRILFHRALSSTPVKTTLAQFGGVHGTQQGANKMWRNKPLFRRETDRIFKTGTEATELLMSEAVRKDG